MRITGRGGGTFVRKSFLHPAMPGVRGRLCAAGALLAGEFLGERKSVISFAGSIERWCRPAICSREGANLTNQVEVLPERIRRAKD